MTSGFDPLAFAQQLGEAMPKAPAPVDQWNPPFCGDIDLVIKRDGTWHYGGTPIGRPKLVRLFASVLKREGDRYYLVTPVEKVGIEVEDVPFMVTAVEAQTTPAEARCFWFETALGDRFRLDADHPLRMGGTPDLPIPYVMVRGGMAGRLSRPVYYELAQYAEPDTSCSSERYYVLSAGERFYLDGLS